MNEPPRASPAVFWGSVVGTVVIGGGLMIASATRSIPAPEYPPAPPSASGVLAAIANPADIAAAAKLRQTATEQCDAGQWSECLVSLEQARMLDIPGDYAADVRALHARVKAAKKAAEDDVVDEPSPSE
jgi:hypothetical protein